jgi:ribosomal protein S18 acetylase RimI-like enzyme
MTLRIRPVTLDDCDALGLVTVTVTAFLSAYVGRIPGAAFDWSWTQQFSANDWRRQLQSNGPNRFMAAVIGQDVVGFIEYGPEGAIPGFGADIGSLYVLPTHQGKGIGKALMLHAASNLEEKGVRSLALGCILENPSHGFYEHLGGVEVAKRPGKADNHETVEIIYGWRDILDLIRRASANRTYSPGVDQ